MDFRALAEARQKQYHLTYRNDDVKAEKVIRPVRKEKIEAREHKTPADVSQQ